MLDFEALGSVERFRGGRGMRFDSGLVCVFVIAGLLCGALISTPASTFAADTPSPLKTADSDKACAGCHKEIYDRYEKTPMAKASGPASSGLLQGGFHHSASNVNYKVFVRDGDGWMSYQRTASPGVEALNGERRLLFFIGSGYRGRTYLYQEEGLWFEAPINYYSKKGIWDMAPNYGASRTMPDGLPVDPNCLHCHATALQPSLESVRNKYADVPFQQGGIGCSACHGDATEHLAQNGHGRILNPTRLDAGKRDSVCLQCHLEGDAAIYLANRSLAGFRPGEELSSYVNYFVKADEEAGGGRAASQYEALLRSRCKIESGDKLTCTTCHDPHGDPEEAERVGFYRAKCLNCHAGMAAEHHPEQQDCATCHMPTRQTTDISHEQLTDHYIQKRPTSGIKLLSLDEASYRLVPVGNIHPADRELGLAYAQAALQGNSEARLQALKLLGRAEASGADDAELHSQYGLIQQLSGDLQGARKEYDRALAEDANNPTALANEAVLNASSGDAENAVRLLKRVVANDPSQVFASLNLAFIECVSGRKSSAAEILTHLERFNPDDPALENFLRHGVYAGQHCDVRGASGVEGR